MLMPHNITGSLPTLSEAILSLWRTGDLHKLAKSEEEDVGPPWCHVEKRIGCIGPRVNAFRIAVVPGEDRYRIEVESKHGGEKEYFDATGRSVAARAKRLERERSQR